VLSSQTHVIWALAAGGTLEDRPRYNITLCFDPFPFPAASPEQQTRIAQLAEQLDAHRKRQQAAHPDLTLTGMYNVLAKLRSGETLTARDKAIHETGLVAILRQLHDELDAAVLAAYGWSDLLPSPTGRGAGGEGGLADALLDRLVALNLERAAEEAAGRIRWLRPDFQNPSAAVDPQKQAKMDLPEKPPSTATAPPKNAPGRPRSPNKSAPSPTSSRRTRKTNPPSPPASPARARGRNASPKSSPCSKPSAAPSSRRADGWGEHVPLHARGVQKSRIDTGSCAGDRTPRVIRGEVLRCLIRSATISPCDSPKTSATSCKTRSIDISAPML
jgi:hypothetical protein